MEDFVEGAICCPWCACAYEFAVCCAQCEEHGVIEFFVVGNEVEFISIHDVEFWSADGFWVVWVGFYGAVVGECYAGFLGFLVSGFWEFGEEVVDVFDYEFGLSPAWADYTDVCVWVGQCIV